MSTDEEVQEINPTSLEVSPRNTANFDRKRKPFKHTESIRSDYANVSTKSKPLNDLAKLSNDILAANLYQLAKSRGLCTTKENLETQSESDYRQKIVNIINSTLDMPTKAFHLTRFFDEKNSKTSDIILTSIIEQMRISNLRAKYGIEMLNEFLKEKQIDFVKILKNFFFDETKNKSENRNLFGDDDEIETSCRLIADIYNEVCKREKKLK